MILPQLRTHLLAQPITDSIFIGFLPAQPDSCLVLRQSGGNTATDTEYDTITFQCVNRALAYDHAESIANQVYAALQFHSSTTTISGAYHIVSVLAVQSPYYTGRDDLNRHTFTTNYIAEYKKEV